MPALDSSPHRLVLGERSLRRNDQERDSYVSFDQKADNRTGKKSLKYGRP
jgi:hypothetical protein